jgi:hypothetical protein
MKRLWASTEIWQRVFVAVTRGADMRGVLTRSVVLSICCTLFTLPYFHYLIFVARGEGTLPSVVNPWGLLFTQLFLLFLLCLLSAMVGFSFSKRLGLPGLGHLKKVKEDISILLALGALVTLLSYFLFDRFFYRISPLSYPKEGLYLLFLPFKGALTEETILRLCLVTLCIGILKRKGAGILLASVVASLFSIKYFHFMGIGWGFNYLFITQLLLSFAAHLLLGYLFVTRGLFYAMALKFLFGIKYGLVSWVMQM